MESVTKEIAGHSYILVKGLSSTNFFFFRKSKGMLILFICTKEAAKKATYRDSIEIVNCNIPQITILLLGLERGCILWFLSS